MTNIKAANQIIKINKVDGKGWLVFAQVTETIRGITVTVPQQAFTFYTKRDAVDFISAH
jgi:hypothetical protein